MTREPELAAGDGRGAGARGDRIVVALELAPVRVNLITGRLRRHPLSASLLGDQLDARRAELRSTPPIGRVVTPPTSPPRRAPHGQHRADRRHL